MTAGSVTTVVAERDCLGQCHVETQCSRNRSGHLRHLESMREARALVVVGEHKNLRLARKSTESRRVQDAITVAFEAGTERIGFFVSCACTRADRACCVGGEEGVLMILAFVSRHETVCPGGCVRVGVREANVGGRMRQHVAGHRGGPHCGAARGVGRGSRTAHKRDDR